MDATTDAASLELDGMYELHAALIEERQNLAAWVTRLRRTRQQRGTFVLGDGAAAGPRLVALQQQIDVVARVIAELTRARPEENRSAPPCGAAAR